MWLGETVPVTIGWYVRRNVRDQTIDVPLFAMDDDFAVAAPPPPAGRNTLSIAAGKHDLDACILCPDR